MLICQLCNSKLSSRSSLRRHIKCKHPDTNSGAATSTGIHRCFICEQTFVRVDALKRHVESHIVSHMRADRCFLCSKGFRRDDLKRHEAVCVRKHLKKIQNSTKLNTSTGSSVVQGPLEFQWNPNTIENSTTGQATSTFEFMRGKTRALDVAAQDFRDLALYAIDRDDLQMCEAIFAAASDLSVSIKDMAKRSMPKLSVDAPSSEPNGRFWYLKLILRGERDINTLFDSYTAWMKQVKYLFSRINSALHLACYQGLTEVAKSLILSGADMDLTIRQGQSPLCLAVKGNHSDTVHFMLSRGANPNTGSPLVYYISSARERLNPEIVIALVQHGANLFATNEYGENVLHYAARYKHQELLRSIFARNPSDEFLLALDHYCRTALHIVVECGFLEGITLLLDACAGAVNIKNMAGQTPLNLALVKCDDSVVERLLENTDRYSQRALDTGLGIAVLHQRSRHVRPLIRSGANLKNYFVPRLLKKAPLGGEVDNETIELLLEEGRRGDFLSPVWINILLEAWIDNAIFDGVYHNDDKTSLEVLRQQYIYSGKLPGADTE